MSLPKGSLEIPSLPFAQSLDTSGDCFEVVILTDIHGNASGLKAVAMDLAKTWDSQFETSPVLVNMGDTFNMGPSPHVVWEWISSHFSLSILGNHEGYTLDYTKDPHQPKYKHPHYGGNAFVLEKLGGEKRYESLLSSWMTHWELPQWGLRFSHGHKESPHPIPSWVEHRLPRDEPPPMGRSQTIRTRALHCYGHVHTSGIFLPHESLRRGHFLPFSASHVTVPQAALLCGSASQPFFLRRHKNRLTAHASYSTIQAKKSPSKLGQSQCWDICIRQHVVEHCASAALNEWASSGIWEWNGAIGLQSLLSGFLAEDLLSPRRQDAHLKPAEKMRLYGWDQILLQAAPTAEVKHAIEVCLLPEVDYMRKHWRLSAPLAAP